MSVAQAFASIPGYRGLLYDVDPIPTVVNKPRARVVTRWVVVATVFILLITLMVLSYTTSSDLRGGIQVMREPQPTPSDIEKWDQNKWTYTCATCIRTQLPPQARVPTSLLCVPLQAHVLPQCQPCHGPSSCQRDTLGSSDPS
jgi:hypothetical protein